MAGVEPQKLIVYNKHLPYSIKKEAERQLSEIKYNLSRAVILQEINPGLSIWFDRFIIYLRLHGRNFTKEDHVLFINLFLNLMEMPEMGPSGIKGIAMLLQKLLKKEELLTRNDLTISWRPLYELVKSIKYSKLTPVGLERFPSKYVETILSVIKYARSYFPVEATQEMLLEFRPLLCPTDATKTNAALYLSLFLPTKIERGTESKTYLLWLDELMEYWFHCTTSNVASVYLRLFSRLAEDNAGYLDWSKYINRIFNFFFCKLSLPINGMRRGFDLKGTMGNSADFAKWFVYMMGGEQGTVIFDKLEKLFVTLKSFYHPSNYDKHSSVLLGFLNALTSVFVMRLNHERYRKPSWTVDIPEKAKITDAEIERYVNIVKEVALLSVYSKQGSLQAALTLQNLALLRADLVIPQLLQSTFEALETLVEPHQVTATLMCITSVARPLASGGGCFPSAPTNILPLLRLVLPGLDPNDFRKSMCAFNFISAIVSLIPLVNCMPAVHAGIEMSEVEKELCLASEQFEDLILQFFDRCFVLVENSTTENITQQDSTLDSTASAQDSMLGRSLVSTVQVVFMQCSKALFEVALDALFRFVSSRVLEVDVAGKLVSDMCRGAVRARPKETLKKMLPYITNRVINLATVEGVQNEEHVDPELLWYLEMLSELGRCNGMELLQYKEVLKEVIKLTIHMKCKKAYSRAAQLLKSILCSVSEVYITEWMSVHYGFDLPPTEHFYIRDWGKPYPLDELNPKWHSPSQEEMQFADELLKEFLVPELELLKEIINGRVLTRDEIHQHLQIIATCLYGAANLLPNWTDKRVEGVALPTLVSRECILNTVNLSDVEKFVCCINRKDVVYQMHNFFNFMSKTHEDDTKSFRMLARIYDILVLHNGVHWSDFNLRWKSASAVKKALADRLHGNKMHVRAVQIERVQLQHDMRVLDQHAAAFSVTDKVVIDDLLFMSTSEYAEVRIHSQKILFGCLEAFDVATRYVLPKMLENIHPKAQVSHEKLKGTLYILQYSRIVYMLIHDWKLMASSWIPIVQANQSEKPSIVKLLNYLIRKIQSKFETMKIERKIGESASKVAKQLLETKSPEARTSLSDSPADDSVYPSDKFMKMGQDKCTKKNEENLANYRRLEQDLSKLLQDTSIHWRCSEMCTKLMNLLLNNEVKSCHEVINTFLNLLVNDSHLLRQYAIRGIMAVLYQYKPQFAKRKLNYPEHNIDASPDVLMKLMPGDNRTDNQWLQYNDTNPINSQEDLERFSFIDKTHWGYQTWPLELDILSNQADFYTKIRNKDCLCKEENLIVDTLNNSEYLEKFIKFHSMEVKKGEDRFQHIHYTLFKGLFRNYGPSMFELFRPVVNDLLAENNESKHRLAIEIIAGMIRGSKHWNYESLTMFWDFMVPLLQNVFASNVMEETVKDWILALVVSTESHDPNRFHRLFTMLLNNPINGDGGSQGDTNRLFILRKTLGQQEWRLANVNHNMMKYLLPHLTHPFQNVREKVGSLVSYILLFDLKYASHTPTLSPRCEMFVDYVYEDILKLYQITLGEIEAHEHQNEAMEIDGVGVTEETKKLERMAKTVLSFLVNKSANFQPVNKALYRIIPLLLVLESREDDPELVGLCKYTFPALASKQLPDDLAQPAIQSIIQVCYNKKSWNLRRTGLNYLMMMVFHNLYILDDEATRNQLQEMLIERLKDEQVEVREIASKLLSGLVHFGYFSITEELLSTFHTMAKIKMKKKRHGIELTQAQTDKNVLALQVKHGGVLGLSALVLAFPYDVCTWIPEVVIDLGNYLHEVPQISATAKKTLSEFRRTHHDNWHIHQQQFTDDQLSALTDLLISPSYYA